MKEAFNVLAVFDVIDNLTKPIDEMQKAMSEFQKSIEKVRERLDKIQDAGKKMAAMGAAITAPFAGAAYLAADFDKAMDEAATLVDMKLSEFRRIYDKQILQLAKETGQAPAVVAKAFYQALSSGLKPDEAIKFLKDAGKSAVGGVSDIFTATDFFTTIKNAYHMTEKQFSKVKDIVFATIKLGKTTFPELAASFQYAGATAASAGVKFAELQAMVAELTAMGISTSRAYTGIGYAIENLVSPTEQAKKALKELGIEVNAVTLKKEGLIGTFKKINKALKALPEEMRSEYISKIFGSMEAQNVFKSFLTAPEKFKEVYGKILNSAGAADKAFEKMARSVSFKFAQMKASMQTLAISIGTLLLPPLNALIETLNRVLKPITDFIQAHQTLAKVLVYPVVGIGLLLTALGSLAMTIGFVGKGVLDFIEFWSMVAPALVSGFTTAASAVLSFGASLATTLVSGLTAATAAVWSFTTALLANPITWVVAGIAGLAAAGYYLYKNWDTVSQHIKGIWQRVKEFLGSIFEGIKVIFQGAISFFSTAWQKFISIFLWTNPITAPIMALKKLYSFAGSINLFDAGKQIIEGLYKGLVSMAKKPLEAIENIGHSIKDRFKALLGISSPSRLFMQFGHFLNEGLGLGMLKSIDVVQDAVKRIASVLNLPEDKRLKIALETAVKGGLPVAAGMLAAGIPTPAVGNDHLPHIKVTVTISNLVVGDKKDAPVVAREITGLTRSELERMLKEIYEQQQRKRY